MADKKKGRKRSSWVGPANPVDPSTNLERPAGEMTDAQRAEASTTSPYIEKEDEKKPRAKRESSGPVGPRPKSKPKTRINLIEAGVREPSNRELNRGVTSVSTKPRKRRQKKQTPVPVPKPGQVGKLDGKGVRVTDENVTQIYDQRRRTTLPEAGREEMTPAPRPTVEPAIMPARLGGSQNKKNLGGFARSHKVVAKATHEALDHLQTMANTQKGTPEHHSAMESFNTLHGHIGQIGNKALHKDLGLGRTIIQQYHGKPELTDALKIHRGIVLGRLEEGRIAEQSRGERSQQGNKGENNGS